MNKKILFIPRLFANLAVNFLNLLIRRVKVTTQRYLKVYCFHCSADIEHIEQEDNNWLCVKCRSTTKLPLNSRYIQLFQEAKINLMSTTESAKFFTAYHLCGLEFIDDPNDHRPIWLSDRKFAVRVNTNIAKDISNSELERMFCAALTTAITYRIK